MNSERQPTEPIDLPENTVTTASDSFAGNGIATAELVLENDPWKALTAPQPEQIILDNHTAVGGANAATALGIWTLVGALLTQWSFINGLIGLGLGIWGLKSPKARRAGIGIALCLAGIFLCLVNVRGFFAGERSIPTVVPIQNPDDSSFDGTAEENN